MRHFSLRNSVWFALLIAIIFPAVSQAGFIEIGLSGNYKKVNLTSDIYDESTSLTGSLSYLFDEMSAIELSYTDGGSKRVISSTVGLGSTTEVSYSMIGLDFILTLGDREAVLRPYFKLGAAYILEKRYQETIEGFAPRPAVVEGSALVPSFGVGFRLLLSKNLSLKGGLDAWSSKAISEDDAKWDYAGRVGLSWMF